MLKREPTQILLTIYWKTLEVEFHRNQMKNDLKSLETIYKSNQGIGTIFQATSDDEI
jgi:hypothetical protein